MAAEHTLEAQVSPRRARSSPASFHMLLTGHGRRGRHPGPPYPDVARLVPAELRLHESDSDVEPYAPGEGWLEVFANRARVLVAEAK